MKRAPWLDAWRRARNLARRPSAASTGQRFAIGRRPTFELLEDRRVFALQVGIALESISENGGVSTATVSRDGNLSAPLTVNLASSDTTEATVPASVVIPANQPSVSFNVTAVNDTVLDGRITVTITASAAAHTNGADTIAIVNDDTFPLGVGTNADVLTAAPGASPGQYLLTTAPTSATLEGVTRITVAGQGTYQTAAANATVLGDQFVPVDLAKTYALSGWAKSGDEFGKRFNPANLQSFGFAAYAADFTLLPHQPSDPYNFVALDSQSVPGDWAWSQHAGVFAGSALPAGTAYIKPVIVATEHGAGNFITWRDTTVSEVPAGTTAAQLAPPVVDLSFDTPGDQRQSIPLSGSPVSWATSLVQVGTSESYTLSVLSYNISETNERPLGFASLDVDKKLIHPLHVTRHAYAADTTLAAALTPGATSLLVTDASGWSNEAWELPDSRSLAWYDYADSTGHTYADYTYTRHVAYDFNDGLWAPGAIAYDVEAGAYRITLNEPWSGPTIAAGAAIRNAAPGSVFNLPEVAPAYDSTNNHAQYLATVGGGLWQQGSRDENAFRPGTAYIQPVFTIGTHTGSVLVGPEEDFVFGSPLDPLARELEATATNQIAIDLDVLAKNAFGPAATVVIDSVATPTHGTATIAPGAGPNGRTVIQYVSTPGLVGTEIVHYTLRNTADNETLAASATIQILGGQVQALGTLRSTVFDAAYTVHAGQSLVVTGSQGLMYQTPGAVRNFSTVRLIAAPDHGTLSLNADGTFQYVPRPGFTGVDAFRYEFLTTAGVKTATARITVTPSVATPVPTNAEALTLERLRLIGIAMRNHEEALKAFPITAPRSHFDAAGNPLVSWRVHLLPYMGLSTLYNQFHLDEPWNSTHNQPLLAQMPDIYRSAGDPAGSTSTRMMTFYGPGASFKPAPPGTGSVKGIVAGAISDGLANTIMAVEAGAGVTVPWTKPEDLPFNPADPAAALGNIIDGIRAVMFAGNALTLPGDLAAAELAALITHNGNETVDAAVLAARESQRRGLIENEFVNVQKFKQLAVGMLDHASARTRFAANTFDAAGQPLLSWRVHILPYIGYTALYNQFRRTEPWDSPHNLALLDHMPDLFRTQGDPFSSTSTHVTTFVGPGAPFPATGTDTTLGPRIQHFTDGTPNTILLVQSGHAAPWTKPVDTPYNANNPASPLGDLGPNFITTMADASTFTRPSSLSLGLLKAYITHTGGENVTSPPPLTPQPHLYIHQSHGDTATNEFGVDWFDVLLESPPLGNVVLTLGISNPAVAALDKASVTFTGANWHIPQRVALRAIDNQAFNPDVAVTVTVGDNVPALTQSFTAVIRDDEQAPPLAADFNGDHVVDGTDFLTWQRNLGAAGAAPSQGDADADAIVGPHDLLAWRQLFGTGAPADFNLDGVVSPADLAAWRLGFGTPNATTGHGDADHDGDADGADLLAWQRNLNAATPAVASSTAATQPLAVFAPTSDLLMGLSTPFTRPVDAEDELAEALASTTADPIPQVARAAVFASLPAYRRQDEDILNLTSEDQAFQAADWNDEQPWRQFPCLEPAAPARAV